MTIVIPKEALNTSQEIRLGDRYISNGVLLQEYIIPYVQGVYGNQEEIIAVPIVTLVAKEV